MEGQWVLAIECNWRIRKLIRANLEALGLTVQEAVSGRHGLQVMGERRPDLILLDVDLLDTDVLHLLGVLNAKFAHDPVPTVALCGEIPDRRFLQHAQVTSCLEKPFSAAALLQHVQQALGSKPLDI